jgi:glycosyltransferase involved in cell wall biosynthesis
MGCPEWEDADFSESPGDDFRPDWRSVELKGFELPKWFAQGEMSECLDYLTARRSGATEATVSRLWEQLLKSSRRKSSQIGSQGIGLVLEKASAIFFRLRSTVARIKSLIVLSDLAWACASLKRSLNKPGLTGWLDFGLKLLALPVLFFGHYVFIPLIVFGTNVIFGTQQSGEWRSLAEVCRFYQVEFPNRDDRLDESDFSPWLAFHEKWRRLFSHYDYIIGYSTDPIIPMLCGFPYFAFEHGTIREIPYQQNPQGRLTSLAYRRADHVFVTNFDCKDSADYLAPHRYSLINHPYDEDHGLSVSGACNLRQQTLVRLDSEFLLFHPTRQDWVEGTGYADKQNDVFLRAFGELRRRGVRIGLVCCSWGSNVEQSKKLLRELGVEKYVLWIAPQAITPFERYCLASDIVVDQFKLGAFGGVVFKAMAVGSPILTFLDADRLSKQYASSPPVINCKTEEDIVSAVARLISRPDELDRIRRASRTWMKSFHGKALTVEAQFSQFRLNPSAEK